MRPARSQRPEHSRHDPEHLDVLRRDHVLAREHSQERAFASSVGADHEHAFPWLNGEVDSVENATWITSITELEATNFNSGRPHDPAC